MPRRAKITQDDVNQAADQLKAEGIKPTPTTVRDSLNAGSFTTVTKMLDLWNSQQEDADKVPVPDVPEFAHRLLEKLHRELYLQSHKALDAERQALEATRAEFENERKEMLAEIEVLEARANKLQAKLGTLGSEKVVITEKLEACQVLNEHLSEDLNQQKIVVATLTERNNQMQQQLTDKVTQLSQAHDREKALQATIAELSKSEKD